MTEQLHLKSIEDNISTMAKSTSMLRHSISRLASSIAENTLLLQQMLDLLPPLPNQHSPDATEVVKQDDGPELLDQMPKQTDSKADDALAGDFGLVQGETIDFQSEQLNAKHYCTFSESVNVSIALVVQLKEGYVDDIASQEQLPNALRSGSLVSDMDNFGDSGHFHNQSGLESFEFISEHGFDPGGKQSGHLATAQVFEKMPKRIDFVPPEISTLMDAEPVRADNDLIPKSNQSSVFHWYEASSICSFATFEFTSSYMLSLPFYNFTVVDESLSSPYLPHASEFLGISKELERLFLSSILRGRWGLLLPRAFIQSKFFDPGISLVNALALVDCSFQVFSELSDIRGGDLDMVLEIIRDYASTFSMDGQPCAISTMVSSLNGAPPILIYCVHLTSNDHNLEMFYRECYIYIDEEKLHILFSTTPNMSDSYAFINGIKIVSMPANLYSTSDDDRGFDFVNPVNPFWILQNKVLETLYRVDISGNSISPADNTSMYRSWSDDGANLSDGEISAASDRVLQNCITDIEVEHQADVISRSNGNGVLVYRDYAVMICRANAHHGRALFCFFLKMDDAAPLLDPLTLWFNGELGFLSLDYGAVMEHGPFQQGGDGNVVKNYSLKLNDHSLKLFELLPEAIIEQLMLERDPHDHVEVAKIETTHPNSFYSFIHLLVCKSAPSAQIQSQLEGLISWDIRFIFELRWTQKAVFVSGFQQMRVRPVAIPEKRVVQRATYLIEQWLIPWEGLLVSEATWVDNKHVLKSLPTFNLEDKVVLKGRVML